MQRTAVVITAAVFIVLSLFLLSLLQAVQLTVVGVVKDHSNVPVAGANVSFDDHSLGMVTTDDAGRFVRLLSAGNHWIFISADGYKNLVEVSASCILL